MIRLTAICLLLFTISCADRNCPDLDSDVMNYSPYIVGDEIVLVNEIGEERMLKVTRVDVTDTKDAAIHKNECNCLVFHRTLVQFSGESFFIEFDFASRSSNAPFFPVHQEQYDWNLEYKEHLTEYTLREGTVEDVVVYEKIDESFGAFTRIVIAKNIGIVEVEYEDGQQFQIQNLNTRREISPSDFDILYWC